eukprot:4949669-Pyramimonas_sp.AAC.1
MAISVYGHTQIGLTGGNFTFLAQLSELASSTPLPVLIAGDWDIDAEVLREPRWREHLGVTIVRPPGPTCHDKCYDFF